LAKLKEKKVVKQWEGIIKSPLKPDYVVLDNYYVKEKYGQVVIASPQVHIREPIYFVSRNLYSPTRK
jgi:hypothetical protein